MGGEAEERWAGDEPHGGGRGGVEARTGRRMVGRGRVPYVGEEALPWVAVLLRGRGWGWGWGGGIWRKRVGSGGRRGAGLKVRLGARREDSGEIVTREPSRGALRGDDGCCCGCCGCGGCWWGLMVWGLLVGGCCCAG